MKTACGTSTLLLFTIAAFLIIATAVGEECGQKEFTLCAEPLDMLHLTSEFSIGAGKKEELDKICAELKKGIKCIQSYTRRCMDLQQRNEFNKLYHGTSQFIRDLCNKGEFQDEYLKHAACSVVARADFDVCAREYRDAMVFINPNRPQENVSMTENIKTICCSLNDLVECYEMAAKKNCGNEAGRFTRELVEKFVNNLNKLYCEYYIREHDACRNGNAAGYLWSPGFMAVLLGAVIQLMLPNIR